MTTYKNYKLQGGEKINLKTARGFSFREGYKEKVMSIRWILDKIKEVVVVEEYPTYILFRVSLNDFNETSYCEALSKANLQNGSAYFELA